MNYIDMLVMFAGLLIVSAILFLILKRWKQLHPLVQPMDSMEGVEFEHFCAKMLEQKGFLEVEVTKSSRDYGVDILAQKDGITYAIQCKCYSEPVGIKAIQEAYAGRDFYDCMVGVVLTNQYFTAPAVEVAKKLKILLWDRGYIDRMLEE
jgi:restriction system protein